MLEEEKSKVAKLEQILANKENQVGQLESVLAQSKLLKPLSIKMVEKRRYREIIFLYSIIFNQTLFLYS